jgi:hypothetical protein
MTGVNLIHVDADRHRGLTLPDGTRLDSLRLTELRKMFAHLAPSPTTTKSELLDLYAASLKRGGI